MTLRFIHVGVPPILRGKVNAGFLFSGRERMWDREGGKEGLLTAETPGYSKNAALLLASREGSLEAKDDHALMLDVALGDKEGLGLLCERHLKSMVVVAQRILGSEAEADEVAQEAFLRLWRQAPIWDPLGTGSVKTWLSRVVTNLCLDRLRRRRSVSLEVAEDIPDPSMSAFDRLGLEERQKLVQKMLLRLPERQRVAIIFAYFEEMSGQEIAQAMDTTASAVESLLVRGKEGLRKEAKTLGLVWGKDL